jgi:hypothetical protein
MTIVVQLRRPGHIPDLLQRAKSRNITPRVRALMQQVVSRRPSFPPYHLPLFGNFWSSSFGKYMYADRRHRARRRCSVLAIVSAAKARRRAGERRSRGSLAQASLAAMHGLSTAGMRDAIEWPRSGKSELWSGVSQETFSRVDINLGINIKPRVSSLPPLDNS